MHATLHSSLSHRFVQSAPSAHAPLQAAGLSPQSDVHSDPVSHVKLQVAPALQSISHVVPNGHVNLQLLLLSHVSLHVR
jgi:hypothetical protein